MVEDNTEDHADDSVAINIELPVSASADAHSDKDHTASSHDGLGVAGLGTAKSDSKDDASDVLDAVLEGLSTVAAAVLGETEATGDSLSRSSRGLTDVTSVAPTSQARSTAIATVEKIERLEQLQAASTRRGSGDLESQSVQVGPFEDTASMQSFKTDEDPFGGDYNAGWHVLRLEYINDRETRRVLVMSRIVLIVGVVGVVAMMVIKTTQDSTYFTQSNALLIANVVLSSCCLAAMLSYTIWYCIRLVVISRTGRKWSTRRLKTVQLSVVKAVINLTAALFYLIPNAYLFNTGNWSGVLVSISALIRWTCWNVIYLVYVVQVHGAAIWTDKSHNRKDAIVLDAPWWFHWPKLVVFVVIQGFIIAAFVLALSTRFTNTTTTHCTVTPAEKGVTSVVLGGFAVYFVMFAFIMWHNFRRLRKHLYQDFRMGHIINRLQLRLRFVAFFFFVVSTLLLWFVEIGSCNSYALTWLGLAALQCVLAAITCVDLFLTFPITSSRRRQLPISAAQLQEFAWLEKDVDRLRRRRDLQAVNPELVGLPMFCFETAIKMFFWTVLIYEYIEVGERVGALTGEVGELLGDLQKAMHTYNLKEHRLFHDTNSETKALVAWSDEAIVVTFRGSIAKANFIADAQFGRVPHPPKRGSVILGTCPLVHQGFLYSWQRNSMNERILRLVFSLVAAARDPHKIKVYVTGHSLGGALATLAAFDIARECELAPHQVLCYTFGAPRTGNRAFAREYDARVPETWHIINDQDIITRAGKLLGLYKRPGQRVIINQFGDLIVRPSFIEATLLQRPCGARLMDHMLGGYQGALLAVLRTQLSADGAKRQRDGIVAAVALLRSSPVIREALKRSGVVKRLRFAAPSEGANPAAINIDPRELVEALKVGAGLDDEAAADDIHDDDDDDHDHKPNGDAGANGDTSGAPRLTSAVLEKHSIGLEALHRAMSAGLAAQAAGEPFGGKRTASGRQKTLYHMPGVAEEDASPTNGDTDMPAISERKTGDAEFDDFSDAVEEAAPAANAVAMQASAVVDELEGVTTAEELAAKLERQNAKATPTGPPQRKDSLNDAVAERALQGNSDGSPGLASGLESSGIAPTAATPAASKASGIGLAGGSVAAQPSAAEMMGTELAQQPMRPTNVESRLRSPFREVSNAASAVAGAAGAAAITAAAEGAAVATTAPHVVDEIVNAASDVVHPQRLRDKIRGVVHTLHHGRAAAEHPEETSEDLSRADMLTSPAERAFRQKRQKQHFRGKLFNKMLGRGPPPTLDS